MENRRIDVQLTNINRKTRVIGTATKLVWLIGVLTIVQSIVFMNTFAEGWVPGLVFVEGLVLLGAGAILHYVHALFIAVGTALDDLSSTV